MRKTSGLVGSRLGVKAPCTGFWRPTLACALCLFIAGCGDDDEQQRSLDPVQLGMNDALEATYDDGELTLYEVKLPVAFPIRAPTAGEREQVNGEEAPPFPHYPWITNKDVEVQITWTLSNLDADNHNVELLIDPWNDFGRYWPGLALVDANDGEFLPNLSGIDILFELPGTESGRPSRRHGTFTFEDMDELAIDFATAINVIQNPPPSEDPMDEYGGATTVVNHAFAVENRSPTDDYSKPYIPALIPGLTGIDLGLRTHEPANIAIEISVEVVDRGSGKVLSEDDTDPPLPEPETFWSVGYGGM
jgi:hypothetical protein